MQLIIIYIIVDIYMYVYLIINLNMIDYFLEITVIIAYIIGKLTYNKDQKEIIKKHIV